MIAPEYFNNHIAVEGEIVVKRVPNDTGSVLVWNSTTKKISTRTVSEIVSDLNVLTTNTNQLVTGLKYFVTKGGNHAPTNNALQIYADDGSLPSMTYSKGGSYVGQVMFDEGGFHFKNGDNNNHYGITAGGFKKSNSNDDYFLTGGGSHLSKYRKEDSWITSHRNFTVGTLISTSIDYSQSQNVAWLLEIKGNVYGNGIPMDCKVQGYIYTDTIINATAYCTNPYFKAIAAMNIGGRLCFWFPRMAYWQGFSVRIHDVTGGGDFPTINQVVSIDDVADPGGSKKVDIGIQTLSTQEWVNSNAWKVYDNGSFRGINDTSDAPFAFLHSEGSMAKKIMTGGVLASNQYSDVQNLPAQGVFARGVIETGDYFRGVALYSPNLAGGQIIQSNSSQIYFGNPSVAQVYLESGDSNLYHNRDGYGAGIIWDQHNFNPNSYIPTSHPVYNISQNDINNWLGYIGYSDDRIIEPNQISTQKLRFGFTSWDNNNGYPYADYIHFGGYQDSSGGNQNLIAIKKNGFGIRQWQGSPQEVSTYQSYVDYWNTGDFTSTDVQNWKNNAGNIVIVNEQDATSLFAKENKFGWINGAMTGAGGINSWVGNYLSIGGNNNGHKSQLLISKDQLLFRGNHGNEDTAFNEVYHSGNIARFIFGDNGTGTINAYDTTGWTHPVKSGFYRPNGLNDWGSLLMWAEHPQTGNGTYGAGIAFDYAGTDAYLTGTYSDGSKEPNKRIWTSGNLNKNEFVRLDSGNTSIDITGTDLNDLQKTGFFKGSSLGHSPTGTTEWFFITAEYHYTGWASQTATTYGTGVDNAQANKIFKRAFIGGSYWTEWVEIATSANNNENRERNYFWQSPVYIGTMINRVYLPEWTVGDVTIRVNSSYHDGYAIGIIEMQFTYGINTGGVWGFEPRITQEFGNTKQWIYIEPKIYYDSSESRPYINVHKFNPASNPIYIDVTLRSFSNNLTNNSVSFKEDATTPVLDLRNDAYVDTKLAGKVNIMENAVGLGFTGGNADLAPYISHSTSGVRFLASQDWVNANFAINSNLSNYVTLNTPQTIIHEKTFNNGLGIAGGQAIWLKGYADTAHRVQWFNDDLDGFAVSTGFAVKPYNNTSINWFLVNDTNAYVQGSAVWHAGNLNPFKNLIFTSDLNTVVESGIYRQEGPISGFSYTTTLNLNSSDGRQQLTIERGGGGMKFRGTTTGSGNSNWSDWNEVYHTGNFNPANYITQSTLNTQLGNYATLVGVQTFTNTNTFSQSPIVPAGTLSGHTVNKSQLDNLQNWVSQNYIDAPDGYSAIISGQDLNNIRNTGFYRGSGLANAPNTGWFFVIVEGHDSSWVKQTVTTYGSGNTANMTYQRVMSGGAWSTWNQVWTTGDFSQSNVNNWNYMSNYGVIVNQQFTNNTGNGLMVVDSYNGGESGIYNEKDGFYLAALQDKYYKYSSSYKDWEGINFNRENNNIGIGTEANDVDKVNVLGSVKATENFKSKYEEPNTLFIPDGNLAYLDDEITNEDYRMRLSHRMIEQQSGVSYYDSDNRMLVIRCTDPGTPFVLGKCFPGQRILVLNAHDSDAQVFEIKNVGRSFKIKPYSSIQLFVWEDMSVYKYAENQMY